MASSSPPLAPCTPRLPGGWSEKELLSPGWPPDGWEGPSVVDIGARVTYPLGHPGPLATSSKESRSSLLGCLTLGLVGRASFSRPHRHEPMRLTHLCLFAYVLPGLHMHFLICILTWFACPPPGLETLSFEPQPPSSQHHAGGSQTTGSPTSPWDHSRLSLRFVVKVTSKYVIADCLLFGNVTDAHLISTRLLPATGCAVGPCHLRSWCGGWAPPAGTWTVCSWTFVSGAAPSQVPLEPSSGVPPLTW